MKTVIYASHGVLWQSSSALRAMVEMIAWLQWKEPELVIGIKELAYIAKGRFNPSGDFAMVMPNGAVVRDPIELANWISQQGLVPL